MSTSSAHIRGGSRIAVLPAAVADQIAAGEVVERPASAVKELVENALDAGATTIEVALEEGGRTLIRVSDDGCGMDRDELLLALERHATSKIRSAADLVGVASFGFRGEALPAVASVSRLEIASATEGGEGTIVRVAGGSVTEVAATTRRTGTTVSVGQLFYNVPARLKFLRSARSEWRAATESLIATALCRRDLRLGVTHDGKSALTLPPASSMRARVAGIWGGTFAERFIEADDVTGPVHVSGLVERPADVGTASRRVFVAVNGRPVRDAGMAPPSFRAFGRRCSSKSCCPLTPSTSTCTRRKPRCGFETAGPSSAPSSTRCAERSVNRGVPRSWALEAGRLRRPHHRPPSRWTSRSSALGMPPRTVCSRPCLTLGWQDREMLTRHTKRDRSMCLRSSS